MFERYSERARRVLFCARYEAAQRGHVSIEPEHLLLGVLRDNSDTVVRFARAGETAETIRQRLEPIGPAAERLSTRVEIPFSPACQLALTKSAAEADDAGNETIRPQHLVLGILVATTGGAVRALQGAGVEANPIRESLRGAPDKPQEPGTLQSSRTHLAGTVDDGSVVRQWTGVVKPGLAIEYLKHLHRETLPALSRLDGFVKARILTRQVDDGIEFQVMTIWRSLDAIKAFAGDDVTRAVVPPEAQALMVRYDDRAIHYDIVW